MVSLVSLQAFFGLAVVVTAVLYLVYRRYDVDSALLAAVGAGLMGLYLTVGILVSLTNVF